MPVKVLIFGQLTDLFGRSEITVVEAADTDALVAELDKAYPGLADSKFAIAVDKKVIDGNTRLQAGDVVALMPPFSGG